MRSEKEQLLFKAENAPFFLGGKESNKKTKNTKRNMKSRKEKHEKQEGETGKDAWEKTRRKGEKAIAP
ncbi:MAG: hypothetical protein LBD15_01350 [Holosporales bacterium]|nr:hypothetical protein [Holosporales bacterium]